MTEARTGRLLAACLHGAIVDALPDRLDYYEEWLTPDGLRDGTIGLAPISAVIGFLRTEGPAYDRVMARAGELAATWWVASLPPATQRAVIWLPRALRRRAALRIAAGAVRDLQRTGRASLRIRRLTAEMEVADSLFCVVRGLHAAPLCRCYATLAVTVLREFGLDAAGRVERCRATGAKTCLIQLDLSGGTSVPDPALAA